MQQTGLSALTKSAIASGDSKGCERSNQKLWFMADFIVTPAKTETDFPHGRGGLCSL